MTDNEIIKAWKWHISPVHCNGMEIYSAVVECSRELAKNTLDLINRQKAEIERLNDYNLNLITANTALSNEILEIKSEAIKEFAKRLKNCFAISGDYLDIINIIDNILKEMTEE